MSRHHLEELLQKVDNTGRDRHSPKVGEEEKHVTAQNCIFFWERHSWPRGPIGKEKCSDTFV